MPARKLERLQMKPGDKVIIVVSRQMAEITWIDWTSKDGESYPETIWLETRFNDGSKPYQADELELI